MSNRQTQPPPVATLAARFEMIASRVDANVRDLEAAYHVLVPVITTLGLRFSLVLDDIADCADVGLTGSEAGTALAHYYRLADTREEWPCNPDRAAVAVSALTAGGGRVAPLALPLRYYHDDTEAMPDPRRWRVSTSPAEPGTDDASDGDRETPDTDS